ncbi:MAG: cytochrome C [Phenylobacterium sp.]|uniref:cytochrome C n=1 Tax=Phenylobacterium sp. TaxID=1871053 RepID=UPI001A2223BE|nr:cytochrome C [Phenylobacterium sp.]MBJ7408785.1 cytochrome C [Phenylobacterium sp.]
MTPPVTALLASAVTVAALGAVLWPSRASSAQPSWPGVANAEQARTDYILKCQGCHRPDGNGDPRSNPPLRGTVAGFLAVSGGREYLGRVPGVAMTDLDDGRLADLLNWTLRRFDPDNLPTDFKPYTAAEIGHLRRAPLRTEAPRVRAELITRMPPAAGAAK